MSEKKIPTILGIFLVLGLVGSLTLLREGTSFLTRASKGITPQEVEITNITSNSFTVSWITGEKTKGFVQVESLDGKVVTDFRDSPGTLGDYDTHYVVINNLSPDTEYKFYLNSGGKEFFEERLKAYSVKTALSTSGIPPEANLASGSVLNGSSQPAAGAIVYLDIPGISKLSALVTNKGNWVVPLAQAYSEDLSMRANYEEGKIIENILAVTGQRGRATATIYTQNDDPVPPIILGESQDFTSGDQNLLNNDLTPSPAMDSKLDTGNLNLGQEKEFKIINPNDGETITIPKPEIFGEGPKGAKVEITLESPVTYESEIEIDSNGEWQWAPPQNLTPGAHTLTVEYTNPDTGGVETFVRTFVLAAQTGEGGPAFSATPSGSTATPTINPTNTPTEAPTPTATAEPTSTTEPTTPPRKSQPSTESGVPESGFFGPTIILFGGAAILFFSLVLI